MRVPAPGPELFDLVKRGLSAQGWTLTAWCQARREQRSHLRFALMGQRNGVKAQKLRAKAIADAKISLLEVFNPTPDGAG